MSNVSYLEQLVQRLMGGIIGQTGKEFSSDYILDGWFLKNLNERLAEELVIGLGLLPAHRLTLEVYLSRLMLALVARQHEGF